MERVFDWREFIKMSPIHGMFWIAVSGSLISFCIGFCLGRDG